MTPLFKKLNFSNQPELVVIDAPSSFDGELKALENITVRRDRRGLHKVSFVIFFVQTLKGVESAAKSLERIPGDPVVWFAYPKNSSQQYTCEFNRNNGWQSVGDRGFEGVRQVSIDGDWSAHGFKGRNLLSL